MGDADWVAVWDVLRVHEGTRTEGTRGGTILEEPVDAEEFWGHGKSRWAGGRRRRAAKQRHGMVDDDSFFIDAVTYAVQLASRLSI